MEFARARRAVGRVARDCLFALTALRLDKHVLLFFSQKRMVEMEDDYMFDLNLSSYPRSVPTFAGRAGCAATRHQDEHRYPRDHHLSRRHLRRCVALGRNLLPAPVHPPRVLQGQGYFHGHGVDGTEAGRLRE